MSGRPMRLLKDLERLLLGKGAAFVGCGDLTGIPSELRDGFPRGISIGAPFEPAAVRRLAEGRGTEFDDEYERVSALRRELGSACVGFMQAGGSRAVVVPGRLSEPDTSTLTAPMPHKTIATRAGVGWIGKCALLVTRTNGAAVRLVSVLTDAPLPVGEPVDESLCGSCRSCVDICPAKAVSGKPWRVGLPREAFFDAFACKHAVDGLKASAGLRRAFCGMCIAACPWTLKYLERSP